MNPFSLPDRVVQIFLSYLVSKTLSTSCKLCKAWTYHWPHVQQQLWVSGPVRRGLISLGSSSQLWGREFLPESQGWAQYWVAQARSPAQCVPDTHQSLSLVLCFAPYRQGGGDRPSPPPSSSNTTGLLLLCPRVVTAFVLLTLYNLNHLHI